MNPIGSTCIERLYQIFTVYVWDGAARTIVHPAFPHFIHLSEPPSG